MLIGGLLTKHADGQEIIRSIMYVFNACLRHLNVELPGINEPAIVATGDADRTLKRTVRHFPLGLQIILAYESHS